MRILIVDDELVSREKLRKMLGDFGQCEVVDNGEDALRVATGQNPPDLILLDIMMPGMDGYEVCKKLKDDRKTFNMPVIFISAKSQHDDETRGLALGAVDYIKKPFCPSIVKARVRTHLELKKYRNHLEELVKERTAELEKTTREMQAEIKDRKKLEAQLWQAQKMESLGNLAGGVAHDFNNLLMAIQGRASIMLRHKDASHPDFVHLDEIANYVQKAADLTKQLLGFARGGKYEVKSTDINELIKESAALFERTRKEIAIHTKYQEAAWTLDVDRGQIDQVLLNLFINAWHAMPGGGDIFIETENVIVNERFIRPFKVKPGNYVKISIADTGLGMDEATRQKIFEPFFTTKKMGRGTGLGLASVYGIIKNHGGFIDVYSEVGQGATFNIYLPASEKEAIKEETGAWGVVTGSGTILLVDDEEMIIDIGKAMIEELGYTVLSARSGREAIKVYRENGEKIDLVILDVVMRDMGGGETYDRLKEISPEVRILLSSGYGINSESTEMLYRRCGGFIQKPFDLEQLSQKLREVLEPGK